MHICILPIFTYIAPAWWPKKNRLDKKRKIIRNSEEKHLKWLNKIQNITFHTIIWCGEQF